MSSEVRPDHAQYLKLYLDLMKEDAKAIFTAAAAAARAVDYLKGLQQKPAPTAEGDAEQGPTRPASDRVDPAGEPSP